MNHGTNPSEEMRECIKNCIACHALCLETASHSLTLGGPHARPKHITGFPNSTLV